MATLYDQIYGLNSGENMYINDYMPPLLNPNMFLNMQGMNQTQPVIQNNNNAYTPNDANPAWMNKLGAGFGLAKDGFGVLGGAMGAWNAYNATKIANKQFKFQKDLMTKQHQNQVNLTNSQLADRQAQRNRRNPAIYESVDSYMSKYGAK